MPDLRADKSSLSLFAVVAAFFAPPFLSYAWPPVAHLLSIVETISSPAPPTTTAQSWWGTTILQSRPKVVGAGKIEIHLGIVDHVGRGGGC